MQRIITIFLAATLILTISNSFAIYHIYDILAKHTAIEFKQTAIIEYLLDEVSK